MCNFHCILLRYSSDITADDDHYSDGNIGIHWYRRRSGFRDGHVGNGADFRRLPVDGIALVAGVDRIFDMGRTTVNITGDASCCIIVSNQESKKEQRRAKKVQP